MHLFFLLFLILCLSQLALAKSVKSFCDISSTDKSKGYISLLNEEFTDEALNRNVWNVIQSDERLTYSWACGRDALCTNNNVYIEDNNLVLRTKKQEKLSPTKADFLYQHTSGGVHTRDKFTIQPTPDSTTRICIRGKLPVGEMKTLEDGSVFDTGKGLWPAYWTLASNARNTGPKDNAEELNMAETATGNFKVPVSIDGYYSCNPDEGEMDIMEHYDSRPDIEATFHFQDDLENGNCKYPKNHGAVTTSVKNVTLSEFHEYAIERTANYIAYYFDGAQIAKWEVGDEGTKGLPLNLNSTAPYYLYLNTAYGGPVSPYDDKFMPEEGFFNRVDYVKVVQHDPNVKPKPEDDFVKDFLPGILVIVISALVIFFAIRAGKKPAEDSMYNASNQTINENLINDSLN